MVGERDLDRIQTLEELSLNALPCLQQILDEGWLLRFADGYTKRANSVTPLYPGGNFLSQKIARCEKIYENFNLPPIFRLTTNPQWLSLDQTLAELGYVKQNAVSVRVKSISDRADISASNTQLNLTITRELSEAWLDNYVHAANVPIQHWQTLSIMLDLIPHPTCYAYLQDRARFCGCALGVLERDYLGIFFLVTAKQQRRKGYGTQLLTAICDWGRNNGATTAYIQVEVANQAGINFYDRLGFRENYQYFYRRQP